MNLTDKLIEKRNESQETGLEFLKQSQKLLGDTSVKENMLLKDIGLGEHIKVAESKVEEQILHETFTQKYEGDIFKLEDIEKVAMEYRLFMKPAKFYRGKIPNDLGAVVLRLVEKHNLSINDSHHSDSGKFYVLAPPTMFSNARTIGDKVNMILAETSRDTKKFFESVKDPDPVIFYKVGDNHFMLLKQWGADFTIGRRILGALTQSNVLAKWGMLLAPIFALLAVIRFFVYGSAKGWFLVQGTGFWANGFAGIGMLVSIVFLIGLFATCWYPLGAKDAWYMINNWSTKSHFERLRRHFGRTDGREL